MQTLLTHEFGVGLLHSTKDNFIQQLAFHHGANAADWLHLSSSSGIGDFDENGRFMPLECCMIKVF
jgi:hypothetical protein